MNPTTSSDINLRLNIESPKDYFSGTIPCSLPIPQNILMFHRKRGKKLQDSNQHHRFLLVLNLKGEGDAIIDGNRISIKEQHAILVFPFQHHMFLNQSEKISWLKITFELGDYHDFEILRNNSFEITENMLNHLKIMTDAYDLNIIKESYLSHKLTFSLSGLLTDIIFENKIIPNKVNLNLMDKINQFIYKNVNNTIQIQTIANKFHYSESRLRAIYKKEMGISLGNYILEIKMHRAQSYLGDENLSISEISKRCGYLSQYAFSNAFKNYHKMSPSDYRKMIFSRKTKTSAKQKL